MLTPKDIHRWLMTADAPACEAFDAHVLASVFALAIDATTRGVPLTQSLGLSPAEIGQTAKTAFPHARSLLDRLGGGPAPEPMDDEVLLRDLLWRGSSDRSQLEGHLATVIARRALQPNHLWQDLGLRDRRELSWLMERHFEPLAARNRADMKWKKFLYRTICRDSDHILCVAPSCGECSDHDLCFGDEVGASLMDTLGTVASRPDEAAQLGDKP